MNDHLRLAALKSNPKNLLLKFVVVYAKEMYLNAMNTCGTILQSLRLVPRVIGIGTFLSDIGKSGIIRHRLFIMWRNTRACANNPLRVDATSIAYRRQLSRNRRSAFAQKCKTTARTERHTINRFWLNRK